MISLLDARKEYKTVGSYGIKYLDDYLSGIRTGDLTLIGAGSGLGKTELAYQIAFNNARNMNVHLFALEADINEPYFRKMYQYIADKYFNNIYKYPKQDMSYKNFLLGKINLPELEKESNDMIEKEYYKLQVHYKESIFTIDTLIKKLNEITAPDSRCDMIILDHIDYFDIQHGDNENSQVTEIINLLRQFNIDWKIPIIIISHMRKKGNRKQIIPDIDDFYGTGNKVKQVKTAIIIAPDSANADYASGLYPTFFSVVKDRLGGGSNLVGIHNFDRNLNWYQESYSLAKLKNYGEEVIQIDNTQYPNWAKENKTFAVKSQEQVSSQKLPF